MLCDRGTPGWHVTAELLRDLELDEIDLGVYVTLLLEHLSRLCPHCSAGVAAYATGAHGSPGGTDGDRSLSESLIERAATPALGFRELEARAGEVVEELLRLPAQGDRMEWIAGNARRCCNPALVETLLVRCRSQVHDSPAESHDLAQLAATVAERLAGGPYGPEFCRDRLAEARAHQANALRAQGDLRGAESLLREARRWAERSFDGFLRAEVASFAASLAKDQRRWDVARDRLDEAEQAYREVGGSRDFVVKIQLKRAEVAYLSGELEEALERVRGILSELDAETMPDLAFFARHNLAWYLCENEEFEAAAEVVEESWTLYEAHPDRSFQIRLRWLRGRIACGLGDVETGERELRYARDAFITGGLGYSAAVVSLDLAALYLTQGRTAEVREIAAWTSTLFESQDVHREALAALTLFRQAAREDALTVAQVRGLARYMVRLRARPASAIEPVS